MAEKIMKNSGYDFKPKQPVPTAYTCMICHLLIRDCTELKCGHSYCKECLKHWEDLRLEENEKLKRFEFYIYH